MGVACINTHNASFPDAANATDLNLSFSTDCATEDCDMPCSACRASHSFACRALSCIWCASTRTLRCLATRTLRFRSNCATASTNSGDVCSGAEAATHISLGMLWACVLMSPTLEALFVAVGEGGGVPCASAMAGTEASIGTLWACIGLFLMYPTLDAPCVEGGVGGTHLVPAPWLAPRCQ